VLFRCCTRELAAAVFGYLPVEVQHKLIKALAPAQAAALLNALPPDDRTAFLDEMPLDVAMQMLSLLSPEERKVAQSLLAQGMFSGWGIRTIDAGEVRYNPMSYHNGSVWPHDNALIAAGFARYGFGDLIQPVLSGLLDASGYFESFRLPELFCGFHRRRGEGPTLYPVACSPQAWAAGSVFLILQAALGLRIDALGGRVTISRPLFPDGLDRVVVRDLAITSDRRIDLLFERRGERIEVDLLRRQGEMEVVVDSSWTLRP